LRSLYEFTRGQESKPDNPMNAPHQPPSVATACPYCGVGCGVLAQPDGRGGAAIEGDASHPANFGRLCSKGSALGETVGLEGRLLHPMMRDEGGALARVPFKQVSWTRALDAVADGFRAIAEKNGPESVAFYLSGQLLTEDYYVANKLMKGFIGSANVDTNSRLCMASSVAGHKRAFGADTVPGTYDDLDTADLIVLVGSNAAWCHPVLFQRMVRNRAERGAKIVVIDPRRTETAEEADLFLPIAPGMDTALFAGLLVHLADTHAFDYGYVHEHTRGIDDALMRSREIAPDAAATAAATGLKREDVETFFRLFATTPRAITCYSQGVNQSAQGTDKVNAIINCHLATGRIGRPGMGPFSLTGQPNAMGGREVGGLANQLAAHMGFTPTEVDCVGRFWHAPHMATREGLKAVDMFDAIATGRIKALWVMATNPAVSLPRARKVRDALRKLDLFVVSENVISNDTVNAGAHILLPAAAWGEKNGTVTNSERRISRQRAFLPMPGEAQPDWWIVSKVARRMGFRDAFPYAGAADVFREHAALSAFENCGTRDFDIGGLKDISDEAYDKLAPVQWPLRAGDAPHDTRFFAEGGFFTPDGKGRFIAPEHPAPRELTTASYPLRLNTGRVRDQWHTMTRTGQSPRLAVHRPEPFVEVHPDDAKRYALTDGGFAAVTTAQGALVLRVVVSEGQRRGSLFVPIHWSAETASDACASDLISALTDPYSGQPEAKATPAVIAPVEFAYHGVARTRHALSLPGGTWWAKVAVVNGSEYRIASDKGPLLWHDFAFDALSRDAQGDATVADAIEGQGYRVAAFVDGGLVSYLCLDPRGAPLSLHAIAALSPQHEFDAARMAQTATMSYDALTTEPVVCACFGISQDTIKDAISKGARNVEDVGKLSKAGTKCGSCLPELKRMIARERTAHTH
jgi:assimilatory nitrate reductase catalytic subunit